ncbi:MAG: hypothetical protein WC644_01220 [Ignavibacteria bacterium]
MEASLISEIGTNYSRLVEYRVDNLYKLNTIRVKFEYLSNIWKQDTSFSSKKYEKYSHPAYKEIISMGYGVVPFIITDLKKEPNFWINALKEITKTDPVINEHKSNIMLTINDWLNWAEENYLNER